MKLAFKIAVAMILGICIVLAIHGHRQVEQASIRFEQTMREDQVALGRLFWPTIARAWRTEGEASAMYLIEYTNQTLKREAVKTTLQIRWVRLEQSGDASHHPRVPVERLDMVRDGQIMTIPYYGENEERYLYTYIPMHIGMEGEPAGALEISGSLKPLYQFVHDTRVSVLATTLIMVGVCGLIAIVVGAFFVGQPIRKLVDVAQRIGAGDLSAKTHLRQRDEIGVLSRAMDRMGDELLTAKTQLEKETQARIRSVEQLRHADRLSSIGTLSSGIAHELGTPLAVISGRASLIADGSIQGNTVAEYAKSIAKQANKMAEIIRQLLDFARRNRSTLSPKNVAKVAEITVDMLVALAAKKNIELELDSTADDDRVEADAVQLQQVLTNLIVNAIHAMPQGGTIKIGVDRRHAQPPADHPGEEGTYLCISVADQGEGIAPEIRDKIFEPFFTTKPVGQGTGLGLAVSYGIVREHGGWIDIDSSIGKGSCFYVYLPLQRTSDET